MLIPFGVLSAAAGVEAGATYELIESAILTSNESSVTFSNLGTYSSTYKHLQIRLAARASRSEQNDGVLVRFNADTGNNYANHYLEGTGSSVFSGASTSRSNINAMAITAANATSNAYGGGVMDILDPYSTTKNTTIRALSGVASNYNLITLNSGFWNNTASITSITLLPFTANFVSGSRFSIYGVRG